MAELILSISELPVADIVCRDRLRPVSEAGVAALLASIGELGVIKDAIHVRKKKDGSFHLMAGGHRLEAAKRLGMQTIPVKAWTCTDDWARLMEIDDNLAGAELTPLDTAVFLARRKEVYERLHPETKRGVAGGLARQGLASDIVSFATATAEKFGLSKRQIERIVAAGERIDPRDASLLRSAPRPVSIADLSEIAKVKSAAERYHVVEALANGKAKSAAEARQAWAYREGAGPSPKDPVEEAFKALRTAWLRAPKAARRRFVETELEGIEDILADVQEGDDE